MADDILYLHCRRCVQAREHAGLEVLVFEGDLMVVCCNKEHGAVHVQPYVGPKLTGCQSPDHTLPEGGKP